MRVGQDDAEPQFAREAVAVGTTGSSGRATGPSPPDRRLSAPIRRFHPRCARPDGFMDFLEATLDPAHEQHRDMVRWYGGPFDQIGFDEERARFGMENMVRRRRGPLASHRSGSRRPKR